MSITGFDSGGTASLNGLVQMDANLMNTDEFCVNTSNCPVLTFAITGFPHAM